ncbi:MAG: ABC-type transport auxiliary lipoprotein family protein [Gammaproteobacteria bacterium]|nr:ABC-type transport auxiliary lipoprotein family protein [Gammaproteobacteria bacterium]
MQLIKSGLLTFLSSLLLTACIGSGSVNIPTDHYYRLPPVAQVEPLSAPLLNGSLAVRALQSQGMLYERAILFIREQKPFEVNPYYYHHWVNTPSTMIQVHMLDYFKNRQLATKLQRYRSDTMSDYVLEGELLHFDRYIKSSAIEVHVTIELNVRNRQTNKEIFQQTYTKKLEAKNSEMAQTISAFGQALNMIYSEFSTDLASVISRSHP